ncbi:protein FAM124A-like isoform X6 [Synchiropus splendidus]|uniref:protein FAM124A-like isoform X6 n=1 Tax=Synchiropus splendidus TaxID=270530 RepID=UPI00237DA978|nr:protein FAM124A-like isoform X6 [Synchiropus splendidus]
MTALQTTCRTALTRLLTRSDYSPLSSTSICGSEISMGELQDPFLVSVHLIADPEEGRFLQSAADTVLAWVHPELQLFRVSERASLSQRPHTKNLQNCGQSPTSQPALAVILFLQEACGGEEHILMLHRALQRPPWHYHHTEEVSSSRQMLPLTPCSQDFYTLAPGTPLWAVRQVHYGKEIVRFTIYCSHDNYADMVQLYKLLLQRRVAQKKEDFCFFVVYSNHDMEIQLSFKRLPRGRSPAVLDSAVIEVRVRDVGALVPLLPNPCCPISEVRWRTEDYDGNKILLQVQGGHFKLRPESSATVPESTSAPSTFNRSTASNSIRRHPQRDMSRPKVQHQSSLTSLLLGSEELDEPELWVDHSKAENQRFHRRTHKSSSLFSLPNLGSANSTCSSPGPSPSPHYRNRSFHKTPSLIPPFRLNVEALVGAEETDVDTGNKVNSGGGMDLSVVSAYIRPSLQQTSQLLSAPPEDVGPSVFPGPQKSSTLGRTPIRSQINLSNSATSTFLPSRLNGSGINTSSAPSLNIVSIYDAAVEKNYTVEEDEQEFYI